MPKKIKVVDVVSEEVKNEEPEPSVNEEVNEPINDSFPQNDEKPNEEPLPDIEDTPKPKAKPKAKPRTKKAPIEVMPEIKEEPKELPKEEPKEEPKTDKVKKVIEQVKCPKCDKMMSSKSLRYTHEQNCKGEVVKTEELPIKRRAKKEPATPPIELNQPVKQENDKKENYIKIVNNNMSNKLEIEIPEELKQEVIKTIQKNTIKNENERR